MKKWLFRIFWIPVLMLAVLFLVANRQMLAISLDPFSATSPAVTTFPMPLWFWLILMLFVGVALGSMATWRSGASQRQKLRLQARDLKSLQGELTVARREAAAVREPDAGPSQREPSSVEPPLLESVNA